MSSQLKEKQQQTDKSHEFEADQLFNKHLFRTVAYAGAGLGAGMVASLFFKHKKMITLLGTGAGAAYGGQGLMSDLNQYQRFKDLGSQGQQPQTLKREDPVATKNWDSFMPKQESSSQQKRYGGSSDDDESRGSKSSSESKNASNKSSEHKSDETTTKSKTQTKNSSESTIASSKVDSQITTTSNRNKDMDKSSTEFGKNKGAVAKDSSHDRHLDKSSQQFGQQKSAGVKSFNPSESIEKNQKSETSKDHKESAPKKQESHNPTTTTSSSSSSSKQESHKTTTPTTQLGKDGNQFERSGTGVSEPHFNFREEGQQLQEFNSYKEPGKPAPGESDVHRGTERPKNSNKDLEHSRDQQNRVEQDRMGNSRKTGNKMKLEPMPENTAGSQFSGQHITAGSQTNVVIE